VKFSCSSTCTILELTSLHGTLRCCLYQRPLTLSSLFHGQLYEKDREVNIKKEFNKNVNNCTQSSDGSGSKTSDPGWVNVLWLGSGQPSMVWVWKISPKNVKFFSFYPSGLKNYFRSGKKVHGSKAGQPLIYCGSKVSSGRVGAHF